MDTAITYYLAGPMTDIPQFNYPLFRRAARTLRMNGYSIVSPAEQDSEEVQNAAMASSTGHRDDVEQQETWGSMLGRDVRMLYEDCGAIILLPRWYKSRGALLECFTAVLLDYSVYFYRPDECPTTLALLPTERVLDTITRNL